MRKRGRREGSRGSVDPAPALTIYTHECLSELGILVSSSNRVSMNVDSHAGLTRAVKLLIHECLYLSCRYRQ